MAHKLPVCKSIRKASECKCYHAVMCAYKCMLLDEPENVALEAAQKVYRFHHPEDRKGDAHLTVERWVNDERVQ